MAKDKRSYLVQLEQFEINIKGSWQELQHDKDFCDVTLVCDEKQILAHKIILSCSSPVLRSILKQNLSQHPAIYLRGVKFQHLENLVNFMYQGEVTIVEEDLPNFIEVARDLKIRGLSESYFSSNSELSSKKNDNDEAEREMMEMMEYAEMVEYAGIQKPKLLNPAGEEVSGYSQVHKPVEMVRIDISEDNTNKKNDNDGAEREMITEKPLEMEYAGIKKPKLLNPAGEEVSGLAESIFGSNSDFLCKKRNDGRDLSAKKITAVEKTGGIHKPFLISPSVEMVRIDISEDNTNQASILRESNTLVKHENRKVISPFLKKGRQYNCNKCGKIYSAFTSLQKHTQSAHEGLRYTCDQCDHLPFGDPSHLRQHIASVHDGVRYPCDQCDYRASRKYQLKMHKNSIHH